MAEPSSNPFVAVEKIAEQLTCSICLELFKNAKALPCQHSFCLECIQQLPLDKREDKYYIACPSCRHPTEVPEAGGVDALPVAFVLNNLIEIHQLSRQVPKDQDMVCDNCQKKDASGYCKQCSAWLCDECVSFHKRWKNFADHKVLDLKGVASTALQLTTPPAPVATQSVNEFSHCLIHDEALKDYCEVCDRVLCHSCAIDSHSDHSYSLITKVYPTHLEQLQKVLESVKGKVVEAAGGLDAIVTRMDEINAQEEVLREEINSHAENVIALVRKCQKEKLEQINIITQHKTRILSQQKGEAMACLDALRSCEKDAEQLVNESQIKFLSEKQKMASRMNMAISQTVIELPKEKANISFVKNKSLIDKAHNIGYVLLDSLFSYDISFNHSLMAGRQATATLTLETKSQESTFVPFDSPPRFTCYLTSCTTAQTIVCDVKETKIGKYMHAVNFTPIARGKHKLTITSEDIDNEHTFIIPCVMPSPELRNEPVTTIGGFNKPMGVAIDKNGLVVVAESGANCITKLSREHRKLSFGLESGGIQFVNPRGVAFTSDRHIIVTDDHRLQKISLDGTLIATAGSGKSGCGQLKYNTPMGVAVHPSTNEVYFADSANNRVVVLTESLAYRCTIGEKGTEFGRFTRPTDVLFSSGSLFVANSGTHSIDVFSSSGHHVRRIGHREMDVRGVGITGATVSVGGELSYPTALAVDAHNHIYISEVSSGILTTRPFYNSRISVYQTNGYYVRCFGRKGTEERDLCDPGGLAIDKDGYLYVCDTGNDRLVIL